MTLEKIYYVGQTIAVVAILASLVALVWQGRQSQKMERAAAQRDLPLRMPEWSRTDSCEGEGAFDRFVLGAREFDKAAPLTQMHFSHFLSEFGFIAESALNMRKDKFCSDGTGAGVEGSVLGPNRTQGGRQWWEHGRKVFGSEIVAYLDRCLQQIDPSTPDFLTAFPMYLGRINEQDAAKQSSFKPQEMKS